MEGKSSADSAIVGRIIPSFLLGGHLNDLGTVHGGYVLELLDKIAAEVARKHAGFLCVTLGLDQTEFLAPIEKGDDLIVYASVNRAWNTSLEVGVRICARSRNGARRHVVSSYLTFVGVSSCPFKPVPVSAVFPQTKKQRQRYLEADERREWRLSQRKKKEHKS